MRAKIYLDGSHVHVEYDDHLNGRVRREFSNPVGGGYVREWDNAGNTRQVCEKLCSTGITLICHETQSLLDLIRREYRAMRRTTIID